MIIISMNQSNPDKDEFNIERDMEPKLKKVETDYVEINVYSNHQIGTVENVPSGEAAQVTWTGFNQTMNIPGMSI